MPGEFFNEAGAEVEQEPGESYTQDISYTRNKPKRKPRPNNSPRKVVVNLM